MRVPAITKNGEVVEFTSYYDYPSEWVELGPFEGPLFYHGVHRGRSAAHTLWKDRAGVTFHIFLKDLGDILTSTTVVVGEVVGKWEPCKRGANYGIRMVKHDK